jgi:two-component system, OmpR family, sensor histidine kinase ArlS
MNFKIRSAILFTTLVAIILLASYVAIYMLYADFKKDEFYLRLEQKALTTYKLLTEVKEIDENMLQVIDRNTINALYDEKVLIFNEQHKLIYSSIDDRAITYSNELLSKIELEGNVRYSDVEVEMVGMAVSDKGIKGIVLASANDQFGKKKLQNLFYILLFSYMAALSITALLSYFYVRQSFAPIDILNSQITRIRQNRLNERVPVTDSQDELNLLAVNFNQMLERIESAFKVQKSFIQHASHELRTPLANLITSCEAALNKDLSLAEYRALIESLNEEHRNLVELTNALLLLSKYESEADALDFPLLRADEILFNTIEEVQELYPGVVFHFHFNEMLANEQKLKLKGNEVLLKTALGNLLRNACKYSDNNEVEVQLMALDGFIRFEITNTGATLDADETDMWMEPFFRGRNAANSKGYGLGLSIANRIAELHKGILSYQKLPQQNTFTLTLPGNNLS